MMNRKEMNAVASLEDLNYLDLELISQLQNVLVHYVIQRKDKIQLSKDLLQDLMEHFLRYIKKYKHTLSRGICKPLLQLPEYCHISKWKYLALLQTPHLVFNFFRV